MKRLIILLFLVVIVFNSGCANQNESIKTTSTTTTVSSTESIVTDEFVNELINLCRSNFEGLGNISKSPSSFNLGNSTDCQYWEIDNYYHLSGCTIYKCSYIEPLDDVIKSEKEARSGIQDISISKITIDGKDVMKIFINWGITYEVQCGNNYMFRTGTLSPTMSPIPNIGISDPATNTIKQAIPICKSLS